MKASNLSSGILYLIPSSLGDYSPYLINEENRIILDELQLFLAESEKKARRFIKQVNPDKKQSELEFFEIGKHTDSSDFKGYIEPLLRGKSMGLLSDAGMPCIADPGAKIVALAHYYNIKVKPLIGGSSIILALVSSGFNGQKFAFNGYLPIKPIERKKEILVFEKMAIKNNQTQLFIETPYRNNALMKDFITYLHPQTLLSVACNLTQEEESITTLSISEWSNTKFDFHKKPCVFSFYNSKEYFLRKLL